MKSIKRSAWGALISRVLMYLMGILGICAFIVLVSEMDLPLWKEIVWRLFSFAVFLGGLFFSTFFWNLSEECENNLEKLVLREQQKGVFRQQMKDLQR